MPMITMYKRGFYQIKTLLINEVLVAVEREQDKLKVPKKYRVDLLAIKREMKERLKNKRLIENITT